MKQLILLKILTMLLGKKKQSFQIVFKIKLQTYKPDSVSRNDIYQNGMVIIYLAVTLLQQSCCLPISAPDKNREASGPPALQNAN